MATRDRVAALKFALDALVNDAAADDRFRRALEAYPPALTLTDAAEACSRKLARHLDAGSAPTAATLEQAVALRRALAALMGREAR